MQNNKNKYKTFASVSIGTVVFSLVTLLGLLLPEIALAAPSFGFDPSCTDRSITDYLAPIFGSLFGNCGGGAGGSGMAFQRAIGILNAGALTLGGILAAYTLVAGTMQTAHDGEMLGKKWSSMWLPIRTVLGVGLVVPISNGFCVAQIILAFIIGQGVGLADSVWTTYLTTLATPKGLAPTNRLPVVNDLAKGVLMSEICVAAFNQIQAKTTNINSTPMALKQSGNTINFGINGGSECGSVSYGAMTTIDSYADKLGGFLNMPTAGTDTVVATHLAGVQAMAGTFSGTASKIVSFRDSAGGAPDVAGDFNSAVTAYQTTVATAVTSVYQNADSIQAFLTSAKTDGWYLAGAWYMRAAALQDMVNSTVANVPSSTPPNLSSWANSLGSDTATAIAPYISQLDNLLATANTTGAASQTSSSISQMTNSDLSANTTNNPFKKGMAYITGLFGEYVFKAFRANPDRSAIMSIKDTGDYVMTASELGLGYGVALVGTAQAAQAFNNNAVVGGLAAIVTFGNSALITGAASGALTAIGYLLIAISSIFFGLGSMIAVYLPLAPFLIYFGAFVGWLILCGEAIIAAPLWGVMHLTPSGDDFMGGARQGYMLILGLLFRPVLIVLGFIFAITAGEVIVQGFNGIFFPAFRLAMAGSVMGPGTILVMLCIYFGTLVWIFHHVFGLIHVIPDKLLRWIGGGGEQLGESARGISKAGESGAGTASRHSDAIRQQAMTGVQTGVQMSASRNAKQQGLEQSAASASMHEKVATGKAAVAETKALGSGAKSSDQLEAISEHLNAAQAAGTAMKAKNEASDQKMNDSDLNEAQSNAMSPHLAKANHLASKMEKGANDSANDLVELRSKPTSNENNAAMQSKAEIASEQYMATGKAYEMLGNNEKSAEMMTKADDILKPFTGGGKSAKASPPPVESDGGDGAGA